MKKMAIVLATGAIALTTFVAAQPPVRKLKVPVIEAKTTVSTADPAAQEAMSTLLDAIATDDYPAFVNAITDEFKAALTKETFNKVVASAAPRMGGGCTAVYLGEMKKAGHKVTLWKLVFDDKGDDIMATLSIKATAPGEKPAKVGGLYLN